MEAYSQTAWRPVKSLVRAHLRKAVNKPICPHLSTAKSSNSRSCRVVVEKPLHDQRGGKVLRSGPANRRKLGEQVEENPFRNRE